MKDLKVLTDEEVVEYVRTKDKESYAEIVLRYQNKLMRYSNSLVHDEQKSVDIVQDAFIKAFINLNSFNSKKKFSTWMYRIVHNEAINKILRYKKEVSLPDDFDIASDEDMELNFSKEEIKIRMSSCITKIPLIYREPLVLFFFEEKSYEEISDILRLPIGTVGTRISRAKNLLKNICQNKK